MSASADVVAITTEDLLAMPEDGVERDLIRGRLQERPMTKQNPLPSQVVLRLGHLLLTWLDQQAPPRGRVLGGEAGFRIFRDPDTTVGIDVAYISADLAANTLRKAKLVEGPPVLAAEVLSPSDKHEETSEKVNEYLAAGVALVWIVDPDFRTVMVYRPGAEPELFNCRQHLSGEPLLPGFQVPVADIFE